MWKDTVADIAGDYLCDRLIDWGVTTIYGFPGDGKLDHQPVVAIVRETFARSVCPTQGLANPALTIMALSSRLAEQIRSGAARDDDPAARAGQAAPARQRAR